IDGDVAGAEILDQSHEARSCCTCAAASMPCQCSFPSLWVSNSSSRGDWELDEVPAVRDPPHIAEIGRRGRGSIGERQWRIAFQGRVAARRVVVGLELSKFPFQVTGIPERYLVEKFSPDRPDEPLDEGV